VWILSAASAFLREGLWWKGRDGFLGLPFWGRVFLVWDRGSVSRAWVLIRSFG
jgi:hypothetical protein